MVQMDFDCFERHRGKSVFGLFAGFRVCYLIIDSFHLASQARLNQGLGGPERFRRDRVP